jgi:hypothetical protein
MHKEELCTFMRRLNPVFEQSSAVLLAQARIPSQDKAIVTMIHDDSYEVIFRG